jgi:hypothetical protein
MYRVANLNRVANPFAKHCEFFTAHQEINNHDPDDHSLIIVKFRIKQNEDYRIVLAGRYITSSQGHKFPAGPWLN